MTVTTATDRLEGVGVVVSTAWLWELELSLVEELELDVCCAESELGV